MSNSLPSTQPDADQKPWPALFALCLGFFMILVDTTIVSVATPALMADLPADVNQVVWVTSAYLLAYAVPILITGRLGDRYGPKNLYLIGLVIFTIASLACGLSQNVEMLIVSRIVQGLGASMLTPQTMSVITRIFPAAHRGQAMALWGATAGIATLVGPILGGVLVDTLGWEWIFIINLPVGVIAFALAWRLVPSLPTSNHAFDWLGVALSGIGMFLLVFGIQEGHQFDWGQIVGPITVWGLIIAGIVVLVGFVWWQARNRREPLMPLGLFSDRNFSLSTGAISMMAFAVTSMSFPLMLYAQIVRGDSTLQAALLLAPMAVMSLVMAPIVGRFTDTLHPRILPTAGMAISAASIWWASRALTTDSGLWDILLPMALLGLGMSGVWAPLAATATRNLPPQSAGAGSGVYNAMRQVGSVLGSAGIAVLMDSRLSAHGLGAAGSPEAGAGALPEMLRAGFAASMSEAMLLPAAALVAGAVVSTAFGASRRGLAATGA